MECRNFERLIHEQLDAREAASAAVEHALASHASACPVCGALAVRYQTLQRAIAALSPSPPAPADFADRFLAGIESAAGDRKPDLRFPRFGWASWRAPVLMPMPARAIAALAMAALLLLTVWVGVRSGWNTGPAGGRGGAPPLATRQIDSAALSAALAEATAATWELARASSAPAARVGREVLDASDLAATTTALSGPVSLLAEDESGSVSASEVLQGMGERVNDGVSPLSGTARHAFGFLFGPALTPPPAEARPHPAEGA
jgi:hypothetical protein